MNKILFCIALLACSITTAFSQKVDNSPIGKLKKDIEFIASPTLEGRLTGSTEALQVADYIESRFRQAKVDAFKGKYKWDFTAKTGMVLGKNAYFKIFDKQLSLGKDFIFMPYSSGNIIRGMALPGVNEQDNVWLISAKQMKLSASNNPQKTIFEAAKECISKGAASVVIFNDIDATQDMTSLNLNLFEPLDKAVAFVNYAVYAADIKPYLRREWIDIDAKLGFEDANSIGKNVVAMVDNKSALTVVIGTSYDHVGNQGGVMCGADYNASGVAALLALAEMVKLNPLKKYNYMFIAFAGHEQELQGSMEFLKQNESFIPGISCMLNLDNLGRYNSNTKELFVSGVGTSNLWDGMLTRANKNGFKLMLDSLGMGYSDHNSFYKRNIPILNFSTGFNEDYLTSQDKIEKINWNGLFGGINFIYNVIVEIDKDTKPTFSKTTDIVSKLEKTKQSLGIIPDFTFDQNGVRVNFSMPNKMGAKAGLKYGDVILKIGPFKIIDFDDYIEAMNKTDNNVETTIVVRRDKNEYKFFVTFQ